MPELRRTMRTVTSNRNIPFGPVETIEEEDDYTIEAETMGEICVALQTIEREVVRSRDGEYIEEHTIENEER